MLPVPPSPEARKKQGHKGISTASSLLTLIRALQEESLSQKEIQEVTGLANNTLTKYIKLLHSFGANLIYISEWRRDSIRGCPTRVYSWGWLGKDVKRPAPMNKTEYARRYRKKKLLKGFKDGIRSEHTF